MMSLVDSRISLHQNNLSIKQNSTIQQLTYLTIGYLPMGLMAVGHYFPLLILSFVAWYLVSRASERKSASVLIISPIILQAIFAIPDSQNVVSQNMGTTWFIGAVLIMSAITYALAVQITRLIEFFGLPSEDELEEESYSKRLIPKSNFWVMIGQTRAWDKVVAYWDEIADRLREKKLPV